MRIPFTTLLNELRATYREQTRAFHFLATRYYLGVDSREQLEAHEQRGTLTHEQVRAIINNR